VQELHALYKVARARQIREDGWEKAKWLAEVRLNAGLEHLTFHLTDVSIHAVAAGPGDGPLLVLLHGFPEFWYSWRGQILPLAEAGFRVVVPDQRGYNQSSKPEGWQAYEVPRLVSDVLGIADRLEQGEFLLAGHDWGGVVAWACAMADEGRIRRLAILNSPHPSVFAKYIRTHAAQVLRSSYMFFMQLPWLPEFLLAAGNFRLLTRTLADTSRPGTFSEQDFEHYRRAWRQPGAVTGMINWYRALRAEIKPIGKPTIEVPVKILWGARDRYLALEMAELSLGYCPKGQLMLQPDAGHWLQHEEPAIISEALKTFFAVQN
jgi:pimeloyl-ACP methyl ester carboxylesterase